MNTDTPIYTILYPLTQSSDLGLDNNIHKKIKWFSFAELNFLTHNKTKWKACGVVVGLPKRGPQNQRIALLGPQDQKPKLVLLFYLFSLFPIPFVNPIFIPSQLLLLAWCFLYSHLLCCLCTWRNKRVAENDDGIG